MFHLLFQLIKIVILASIYSFLILNLLKQIKKSEHESWFQRVTSNRKKFLSKSRILIGITLFVWMFTYWGNHGLGDYARIPIGNGYAIENINWTEYGHIETLKTSNNKEIHTTKFKIEERKLIGNLVSWFYFYENAYFIFDIKTEELIEFKNKVTFDEFTNKNGLPNSNDLKVFRRNYLDYWGTWRFLLLP